VKSSLLTLSQTYVTPSQPLLSTIKKKSKQYPPSPLEAAKKGKAC
jgi:hypothetical protein